MCRALEVLELSCKRVYAAGMSKEQEAISVAGIN